MQHTKIIFPALLKVEVIPKLNPTVLKAENISKTNDMNFCSPSVIDNANIDIEIVTSERVMIANALLMALYNLITNIKIMGRYTTGAETIDNSYLIDLSYLRKQNLLTKGQRNFGQLNWNRRGERIGSIQYEANYLDPENIYLRLAYTLTENREGKEYKYDYNIRIIEVPSNLGKGKVLYFVCPDTGNNCRKLYRAYGSHKWKSREAYEHRLYYPNQMESKRWRVNSRYFELTRELENNTMRRTYKYKGKETRRYKKRQKLFELMDRVDSIRYQQLETEFFK